MTQVKLDDGWILTTEEVRNMYIAGHGLLIADEHAASFDLWLAKHDEEILEAPLTQIREHTPTAEPMSDTAREALADEIENIETDWEGAWRSGDDGHGPRADYLAHNLINGDWLAAHDAELTERVRAAQREQIITMIDASPAVTWTGKGGVRERIAATQEATDEL